MGWRYRLDVEYDGTEFAGWQVQPGRRTVQGELTRLLTRLGESARPTGAGRTDAGVHAFANVAHVDLEREWDGAELAAALAALSPSDLAVVGATRVEPSFHARYAAVSRTYHYCLGRARDPFFRHRRWTPHVLPDPGWARGELSSIRGEGDFTSWAKSGGETRTMCVDLQGATWDRHEGGAVLTVTADRFLYGMVRALVGTLVGGFEGGAPAGHLGRVLAARDRGAAGAGAPAAGLYLGRVRYPGEAEVDMRAEAAQRAGLGPLREERPGGSTTQEVEE